MTTPTPPTPDPAEMAAERVLLSRCCKVTNLKGFGMTIICGIPHGMCSACGITAAFDEYQHKEDPAELREALEGYIKLLLEELDEVVPLAHMHGWRSSRYQKGVDLRARIENARRVLARHTP